MASDRRRGFEAWARTHGDPAVRGHDRRAIAEDLYEIAGHHEVCTAHIETLARRYRERFAGAQKILLAQQVGDEILRFQETPVAVRSRTGDARREDDEVLGLEVAALPPPPIELRPPSARPGPPAAVDLGGRGSPLPLPPPLAIPPAPASSQPSGAAERARSEAALDWSVPARPATGSAAVGSAAVGARELPAVEAGASAGDQGLWGAPGGPSASGGLELSTSDRPPPRPISSRPAPPADHGGLEVEGLPARPAARPRPAEAAPPVPPEAPPSRPPSAPALPLRDRIASLGPKGLGAAGGLLAAMLLLALLVTRPSCLFRPPAAAVEGRFASKHLGLAVTFPERWTHEAARDEDETRGDWTRASTVFFQGVQVDEFAIQLTLVTLTHDDRPATEEDLRTVAASELASGTEARSCASYTRFEGKAVRCTSILSRLDRRFAMLEEYFVAGPRLVYARGLVETAIPDLAETAPSADPSAEPPGAARGDTQERSPLPELDARRLETILDSIQPLGE